MMGFVKIEPADIKENLALTIAREWMLITAGNREKLNTMTASWGGVGELWGKPVTFAFVRSTRYTLQFLQNEDHYTLSFYPEKYKKELSLCGSKSGRDVDKVKECGFKTEFAQCGAPYFAQARLVLVCRKLYVDDIKPELFLDRHINDWYPEKDYHKVFVGEIIEVLKKEG